MPQKNDHNLREALSYIEAFPHAKITKVARDFGVSRDILRRRIDGIGGYEQRKPNGLRLNEAEEHAICEYIDRLDRINLAVRTETIKDVANYILKAKFAALPESPNPPTVGQNWVGRFIKRHNYSRRLQKKMAADRKGAEDIDVINLYYVRLREAIQTYGFSPSDIWNMDETGFRIGVANDQFIVTKRKTAHYFGLPENRESATSIEAISAAGDHIPAFLILCGQVHQANWYNTPELSPDTAIQVSPTGYSNDEISLDWIKHFNRHTVNKAVGSKRLLILDGHGSHHTRQFIQYCDEAGIVPFGMPPHLTHLLQPLDVVVFQPLKHYHTKALEIMVRDGLTNITKLEFLSCIQGVRIQAFKTSTIKSAFKKTGIYPLNPLVVLSKLQNRTPSPRPSQRIRLPSSSPARIPTTVRHIHKTARRIENALTDLGDLDPDLIANITNFIAGSISNVTELLQTKRDLGRTTYAEKVVKARRAAKNTPLQAGGVLTVAEGRQMVRQRAENDVEKARRVVEAADRRVRNVVKRVFLEAAKQARKWRTTGRLPPAYVIDSEGKGRDLRRF